MRTIYFLSGAQGSGKNTFINEYHLSDHAIGYDDIRRLASGYLPAIDNSSISIPGNLEKKICDITEVCIKNRMRNNETIFLNNTHVTLSSITKWYPLINKYGYQFFIVDIQGNMSDKTLLYRNSERKNDIVPEETVVSFAAKQRALKNNNPNLPWITPHQAIKQLHIPVPTENSHRVIVFGDIHSSGTALDLAIKDIQPTAKDLIVFIGDLFDRGNEPEKVWDIITDISSNYRTVFIEGNHEYNLRSIIHGTNMNVKTSTSETLARLHDHGVTDAHILAWLDNQIPLHVFGYGDKFIWLNHGGIIDLPTIRYHKDDTIVVYYGNLLSNRYFQHGTRSQETTYRDIGDYDSNVDQIFQASLPEDSCDLQIHGHRHYADDTADYRSVINLDSNVEYAGGTLKYVILTKNKDNTVQIDKRSVVNPIGCFVRKSAKARQIKQAIMPLKVRLEETPTIAVKQITGTDLFACNVTRKAAWTCDWTPREKIARGLIIDQDGRIISRAYDKFFNINEKPETQLGTLKDALKFPCTIETKMNGYLALVTAYQNELLVTTKSGITDYSKHFQTILENHLGDKLTSFIESLTKRNVTLTFEAITANDPHIIDQTSMDTPVLLHAVAKTERQILLPIVADNFITEYHFTAPDRKTVATWQELMDTIREADASHIEGLVIIDNSGYMTKFKTDFYLTWKKVRAYLAKYMSKPEIADKNLPSGEVGNIITEIMQRFTREELQENYMTVTPTGGHSVNIPKIRTELYKKNI